MTDSLHRAGWLVRQDELGRFAWLAELNDRRDEGTEDDQVVAVEAAQAAYSQLEQEEAAEVPVAAAPAAEPQPDQAPPAAESPVVADPATEPAPQGQEQQLPDPDAIV